ncbi:MAG: hypothetical protein HY092_01770 [Candidatus Kerfeldbacteria bacterium]|nr:hypothetical protein [Candidatus Kerfeldbacteria bacterium]
MSDSQVREHVRQALHKEYSEVTASWRFFTQIRFTLLAFAATLLSGLFAGYHYILANAASLGDLEVMAVIGVPSFGALATCAILLTEWRTRRLYGSCLVRGIQIEDALGLSNGHLHQIWEVPKILWIGSHTLAIGFIYVVVFGAWGFLYLRAVTLATWRLWNAFVH